MSFINDKFIVQYLQGLLALTNPESKHYEKFLNAFSPEPMLITKALNGEKLSIGDIAVVKELMQKNMAEYEMKGEYQICCYSAMLAFFQTAYCILTQKIDFIIKHIDMIADLDDELESIQLYESSEPIDCLGIDRDTREHINRIYDFKSGCVKTECLHEGWQTSGSVRIVRMAFNLYCDGKTSFLTWDYIRESHPRTAIGYYESGHYCLLCVDGRQPDYSRGMFPEEMAKLFEKLGCKAAYNLDGGHCTFMTMKDTVVNHPYKSEHKVPDGIFIKEALQ